MVPRLVRERIGRPARTQPRDLQEGGVLSRPAPPGIELGVDFGTSHTVAVLRRPDGRVRLLLFDGSPLLSSGICRLGDDLLTGADARHIADSAPSSFEPAPKARIDDGTVLLGTDAVPVAELVAAVLARVRDEAVRISGAPVDTLVLTHPAVWAAHRRSVLTEAARIAGLPEPALMAEPVAAARYFAHRLPELATVGATALVYDFGAGTFDATVLRRDATGPVLLGTSGLPDAGGLDLDQAIVTYLEARSADRHPDVWRRLTGPVTDADRRARQQLWQSVRTAKEMLSRVPEASVHLPVAELDLPLDRATFERLATPVVQRTVRCCRAALVAAGLPADRLDRVVLVGGSSRIPLVATLLAAEFGRAPVAVDQPELVVVQGSLPDGRASTSPPVPPARPSARPRSRVGVAVGAVLAAALLAAAGWVVTTVPADPPTTWHPAAARASAAPTPSDRPMSPVLAEFARNWTGDGTCRPVGFEGPFAVPDGITAEMVERYRCDYNAGYLQGASAWFVRFGAASALDAFRSHYHSTSSGWDPKASRNGRPAVLWYDSHLRRCLGWLESDTALLDHFYLSRALARDDPPAGTTTELRNDVCVP